ncbi:MAG: 1-acyl-sn-glycerol-3-phosphate acyltransferase [Breznakibacter sp.]
MHLRSFSGCSIKNLKSNRPKAFREIIDAFLKNYINRSGEEYYVATVLKVKDGGKPQLISRLMTNPDVVVFDQQLFVNKLLDILNENFNKLSTLSMAVVFGMLMLYYGRIELALVTFIPISLGWLWTVGLMGLFGIEFNIFNVIISSFVIGLGLDYSVFMVSGLIDDYKYGQAPLERFKISVFMSALTTVGGFGVLIFARHPAIKSIASVSVIGLAAILTITFIITPTLFRILVNSGSRRRIQPIVLSNALLSIGTFLLFLAGALIMTLHIPLLMVAPVKRRRKKHAISSIICFFSKLIVAVIFPIRKRMIDTHKLDFSKPSVIISNHQSHLDLVLLLMQHPRIIVFTNKWVYNNIFYGAIIRFADYYPAYKGIEDGFDKIRQKVADGYSILIFPEGKRTLDGGINRFHQGAFSVAHELGLDIQPVMIHGAYDCLPKTDFFLKSGQVTFKCFDRITPMPEETGHGITFRKQAKEVTAFYREAYSQLRTEVETPAYFRKMLVHQYLYKGPVLEWYMRVKLHLEKDYQFFNSIIPRKANIVDVGCGFGFLSYMLWLVSRGRQVTGIDYDEEKISVAANLPAKGNGISFKAMDIAREDLPEGDVFIFNDVLHYLPEARQAEIVERCMGALPVNGMIIIRDADSDMKKRTFRTKLTEFQSTKIFKFNKADYKLTFVPGRLIKDLAARKGLSCEVVDKSYLGTSNITYVIKRQP